MVTLLRKWRAPTILVTIHWLLVYAVYRDYLSTIARGGDDPAMLWLWPMLFDFPASLLVLKIDPEGGMESAVAFWIVGGIQWLIIGIIAALLFPSRRDVTPTI